jgi:hypothetical protein
MLLVYIVYTHYTSSLPNFKALHLQKILLHTANLQLKFAVYRQQPKLKAVLCPATELKYPPN